LTHFPPTSVLAVPTALNGRAGGCRVETATTAKAAPSATAMVRMPILEPPPVRNIRR
jgi:hypothetical protein